MVDTKAKKVQFYLDLKKGISHLACLTNMINDLMAWFD